MSGSSSSIPRIHIVGRRNAGKTTLVCDLVRTLTERGLRVATVKHTHHNHELDTPGKDSHRHREAGAAGVGIVTPHLTAAFIPSERATGIDSSYDRLGMLFSDCDLMLVEGDLHAGAIRLEVWRSETGEPPYAVKESSIRAVITDDSPDINTPVWPRLNLTTLADHILELLHAK